MKFVVTATLLSLAVLARSPNAAHATAAELCSATIDFSNVDRPRLVETPCALAPGRITVESGYYQNASSVGGTALAAFPNTRVRVGLGHRTEASFDAPREIAKSGLSGAGIFTFEHSGLGVKSIVRARPHFIFAAGAEIAPPNSPLSLLDAREYYSLGAQTLWSVGTVRIGAATSLVNGRRFGRRARNEVSLRDGISIGRDIDKITHVTGELLTQTGGRRNGTHAYASGDVMVQRRLAPAVLFDVEIGTSFDEIRNTKPHYIGAGLSFSPQP